MTALWCGWLGQSNSHERREGRSDVSAGRVVRTCTLASCLVVAAILALALPAASESRIPEKLESRIVDLGTLPGGWYSYANGINDVAQIVGYGNIEGGCCHAFVWENGAMTDLGTLGGSIAYAYGINDWGQVVGESTSGTAWHAFLWENGAMTDLGVLPQGDFSYAYAINDVGQVVGGSDTVEYGFVHAFVWENGTMTDLGGLLGGEYGEGTAHDINNMGQVVGSSLTATREHAVLWENGMVRDLGALPGESISGAFGINDRGQVVGASLLGAYSWHAFFWEDGTMVDLGTLGGTQSEAYDINDAGQIVGVSNDSAGHWHSVLWENGQIKDLGTLTDGGASRGAAINEAGQVVGWSDVSPWDWHAVMWAGAPAAHDVAVTSASATPLSGPIGSRFTISASVRNVGTERATFDVEAYAGSVLIGITTVTDLGAGTATGVSFTWDTSIAPPEPLRPGSYPVKVIAVPVAGETDIRDNSYNDGTIVLSGWTRVKTFPTPVEVGANPMAEGVARGPTPIPGIGGTGAARTAQSPLDRGSRMVATQVVVFPPKNLPFRAAGGAGPGS